MEYVEAHGRIARKNVIELCGITENQAKGLLKKMCDKGKLQQMGKPRRGTYYIAAE
jgi:ATP-dependent DNA helicase RecG